MNKKVIVAIIVLLIITAIVGYIIYSNNKPSLYGIYSGVGYNGRHGSSTDDVNVTLTLSDDMTYESNILGTEGGYKWRYTGDKIVLTIPTGNRPIDKDEYFSFTIVKYGKQLMYESGKGTVFLDKIN